MRYIVKVRRLRRTIHTDICETLADACQAASRWDAKANCEISIESCK